jgi:hypothetical protein
MTSEEFMALAEVTLNEYRTEFRDFASTTRYEILSIAGTAAADKYSVAIEDLEEIRLEMEAHTLETIRTLASMPEEVRNIACVPVLESYTSGFIAMLKVKMKFVFK